MLSLQAKTIERFGQIDILVNNAGNNWAAPAEDYPDLAWRKVMSLNVDAQFFLAREVGKRSMIPRRSGKIVNIASIAGLFGNPPEWGMQTMAYNTSKGALVNFTRDLAGPLDFGLVGFEDLEEFRGALAAVITGHTMHEGYSLQGTFFSTAREEN